MSIYDEYYRDTYLGDTAEKAFKNLLDEAKDHKDNPRYDAWAYLDSQHPPRPDQVSGFGFEIVSQTPVHPDVANRIAGELTRSKDERLQDTYLAIAVSAPENYEISRTEQLDIFVGPDANMWGDKLVFEFEKAGKIKPGEIVSRERTLKHERHRAAHPTIHAHEGVVKYVIREDDLPLGMGGIKGEFDTVQEAVDTCVTHTQTPQKSYRGGQRTYTVVVVVKQADTGKALATIETETLGYDSIYEVDVLVETKPAKTYAWMFVGPAYEWDGTHENSEPEPLDIATE